MLKAVLLGAVVSSVCLVGGCFVPDSCTLVGCVNQVTVAPRTLRVSTNEVSKLVLRACRNERCETSTLKWNDANAEYSCTLGEGKDATPRESQCTLRAKSAVSGPAADPDQPIEFTLSMGATEVVAEFKDGDRYAFTLSRSDSGAVLTDVSTTVNYRVTQPNGPQCESTCRSAEIP